MDFKKVMGPAGWIIVYLAIGWLIGATTSDATTTWYQTLDKPPLNPPPLVFPIVWTALYIMIALAGWMIWSARHTRAGRVTLILFLIQTGMNWLWSFIFFEWHLLGPAFGWIMGLIGLVAVLLYRVRDRKLVAGLLFPYFMWLCFAAYLAGSIWRLN